MKPLTQAAPAQSSVSWWTAAPRDGFTKYVERTEQTRMSASTLGKGRNRPITTNELEPR